MKRLLVVAMVVASVIVASTFSPMQKANAETLMTAQKNDPQVAQAEPTADTTKPEETNAPAPKDTASPAAEDTTKDPTPAQDTSKPNDSAAKEEVSKPKQPATTSDAAKPVATASQATPVRNQVQKVDADAQNTMPVGEVKVDIPFAIPMKAVPSSAMNLTLEISCNDTKKEIPLGSGTENGTMEIGTIPVSYVMKATQMDDKLTAIEVVFEGVPQATYRLKVFGSGYSTVTKNVEITDYSKMITLSNDETFLVGDVNDDKQVNETDYQDILKAIDHNSAENLKKYDLNRDGVIDIEDLNMVAKNVGVVPKKATENITGVIVNTKNVVVNTPENATIQNPKNMLLANATAPTIVSLKDSQDTISAQTPVSVDINFDSDKIMSQVAIASPLNGNGISKGELIIEDTNGGYTTKPFQRDFSRMMMRSAFSDADVIVIDLGKQIAVKKITIKITDTSGTQKNLAEIAKVTFLNDVYDTMPEKEIAYPKNVEAKAGSEKIAIHWDEVSNIEGYMVKYVYLDNKTGQMKTVEQKTTQTSLNLEDLQNFTTYTISVQSTSGDSWKSGYGPSVTATPMPSAKPSAPEDVSGSGEYKKINIKWSKNKDAVFYNVYYRLDGSDKYIKTDNLKTTSTTISVAKEGKYTAYVTASNAHGESAPSKTVAMQTKELKLPDIFNYNLINRSNGQGKPTQHITDVEYPVGKVANKFDMVDDDAHTYWKYSGWNTGGFGNSAQNGQIITFDQPYKIKQVAFVPSYEQNMGFFYVKANYWSQDDGERKQVPNPTMKECKDKDNLTYYLITFAQPVEAKKLQINLGLYLASGPMTISEMRFYQYDSIEDDINNAYTDDLHLTLRPDVDAAYLDKLQKRLDTKDPISQELNPNYAQLNSEIAYAREILEKQNKTDLIEVDQQVSTENDGHLKFAYPLSDLQPLGISVRAKDQLTVYVGADKGANYGLQLVFTQYHGTSSAWQKSIPLNKGKNVITVPDLITTTDEHGGSMYLRYTNKQPTGDAADKKIQVRVTGGQKIPYLNLTGMEKESKEANMQKINTYVSTLQTYVTTTLPSLYKNTTFDSTSSVLNTTEIMTDKGLLSVPADSIWKAIANKSDKSEALYQSAQALEQLIRMGYTSRGLFDTKNNTINAMPMTRVNIRYSTMFNGAYMYAGGSHIGVPYEVASSLATGKPYTKAEGAQKYSGGDLFGWGMAHELGHTIDAPGMIYGETSNNLISLFSQTFGEVGPSRIGSDDSMKKIYAKVTSGTQGVDPDVFTSLGMFWQLHLAYDNTYISPDNVSPFYQKLYTLYRENTDQVDRDNLFIRLASDAAQKDLTEYFARWGLTASPDTLAYLKSKGYPKETRDIFYLSETARYKRIEGMTPMAADTQVQASLKRDVDQSGNEYKDVTINLGVNKDADKILGYEIKRNGKVVGFTSDATYVDQLGSLNNRVFTYEITAYDYLLNKTATIKLDPIKVKHDGSLAKTAWTLSSNVDADQNIEGGDKDNPRLQTLINQNYRDKYQGTATEKATSVQFVVGLGKKESVAGIKFTAALDGDQLDAKTPKKYNVEISSDNTNWKSVATGNVTFKKDNPSTIIYFSEGGDASQNQLGIFDAAYVRITFYQKTVSLSEIDILAPPGDNVELIENGIGILKDDYTYAPGEVIPKGSLVFNGKYRGNPAFNAVLLFDENEKNVVGTDKTVHSIILAQIPSEGELYEVSDGNWIYWIDPGDFDIHNLPKQVKAELFRVDDPVTLKGQRFVSDTLYVTLPDQLPQIELKGQVGN